MAAVGNLTGKTAIVTGAGRGIGYAYAERLLRDGADVVVAELNGDIGVRATAALAPLGTVEFVQTDVADAASAEACARAAVEHFGRIDILVNNAGLYGDWDSTDQSLGYLRTMFDINLHGSWLMAGAVAPHLVAAGGGRIINQASGAAYNYVPAARPDDYDGLPSFNYQQSKWGVVGLTRYLAGYLGRWGITVNCIAPGVIATEATMQKVSHEIIDRLAEQQSVPGRLEAEDLCGAMAFFASAESRFVTGQVLVIDGGRHMPA